MTRREKFIILILAIILIALALWADRCHAQPAGHHLRTNLVVVAEPCQTFNYWAIRTDGGMTHLISILDHISGEFERDLKVMPSNYLAVIKIEGSGGATCIWHANSTRVSQKSATAASPPMPQESMIPTKNSINPWLPVYFTWQCIGAYLQRDPITGWETQSAILLSFLAESNRCYQVEFTTDRSSTNAHWRALRDWCPRSQTEQGSIVAPLPNCTWLEGYTNNIAPTNLLDSGIGWAYRLVGHY